MNVVTEDIVQLSKPTYNFPLVRLPTLLDISVRPVHYPACNLEPVTCVHSVNDLISDHSHLRCGIVAALPCGGRDCQPLPSPLCCGFCLAFAFVAVMVTRSWSWLRQPLSLSSSLRHHGCSLAIVVDTVGAANHRGHLRGRGSRCCYHPSSLRRNRCFGSRLTVTAVVAAAIIATIVALSPCGRCGRCRCRHDDGPIRAIVAAHVLIGRTYRCVGGMPRCWWRSSTWSGLGPLAAASGPTQTARG